MAMDPRGPGDLTVKTAPWPIALMAIYVSATFPLHSMCNVTRVIFDCCGKDTAAKYMPLGYLSQGWLLVPLLASWFTFKTVTTTIAVVDYIQHLVATAYWSYCYWQKINRPRTARLLLGVTWHMLSLVPMGLYFYVLKSTS